MPDIFLSYSREDQDTARRFADAFEREGFSVWWDQTLRSGENYDQVTETALREAKAVVVLWSKHSVDSRWVRAEATQADRNGTLMPVMIEPCNRPIMFELKHTADLSHWKGETNDRAWQAYVADVRRFVQKDAPQPAAVPAMVSQARKSGGPAVGIAVAGLALAGALFWMMTRAPVGTEVADAAARDVVAPTAAAVTLAVLPFADMSAARDQEYFSDGLTEEILNQLAQIKALRVTGRTSSFSFKGKNEDLRVIGQKLGVANLLEGSIRKDGDQLRITAQLINAADGTHLWSRTYDRELTKVFLLQEDIAKDVAKALSIRLDVGDLPRAQGGTTNVEAYDKYLRGKQLVLQEGRSEFIQSAQLFREAVAIDPGFTLGWMWLADALRFQVERDPDDMDAVNAELATARARVLQLAPQSGLARQVRALDYIQHRKWLDAEATLQLSDKSNLSPGPQSEFASARELFLVRVGRVRELQQMTERASKQDPLSLAASTTLQTVFDLSGRTVDAQSEYKRSKALQGDHGRADHFALVRLLRQEDVDQAQVRAQFDVFLKSEPLPMKISAVLRERLDRPEAAREAIREALNDPENEHPIRMFIVSLYADAYGDRETAMQALLRSTELSRGMPATFFGWYPYKTALRNDPRYKQMIREQGLLDYWRASGNWGDYCKPVGADDFECR